MSKEKTIIKTADGTEVDSDAVKLLMLMIKHSIASIKFSYSGAGDDGDFDSVAFYGEPTGVDENGEIEEPEIMLRKTNPTEAEEMEKMVYAITESKVPIDFNNDGCSGSVDIHIEDGVLKFSADHAEYYTESRDSSYDEELIDGSML